MNTQDLELAQFLHCTAESARKYAERLDPKRKHADRLSQKLDSIARSAAFEFLCLTGRGVYEVPLTDLNTVTPAAWAKSK